MNIRIVLFIFTISLVSCNGRSGSSTLVWDMPTPYPDTVFHTQNIQQFVEEVHKGTHGALTIRVHPGASIYNHPEIKRAVRGNQVPIGEVLMSLLGNENVIFQIDVLPLLATDYTQAKELWKASREEIAKLLDEQGLKLLFAVPWPPQGLYTKKKINSLTDMQGMKVRAYNPMLSGLVQLMGGIPTTVQTPEIPQAFSTGIIEAMMTSPSTGVSSQSWDYVDYYYDFQAWIPKNMVIVNKEVFEALSISIKQAIEAAAKNAEERGWQLSEKETIEKTDTLVKNGIKVMLPSRQFKQELNVIRKQMAEQWEKDAGERGKKILEAYEKLLSSKEQFSSTQ